MVTKTPGITDYKKQRGERRGNFESRMLETNSATTKYNWMPRGNRGVRNTKTGGRAFQRPAKPDRGE
jgi:hypothetical protein